MIRSEPTIGDNLPGGQLRAFVERIERLEEEIKAINGDKSEIYKEARGSGFDVKTIRKVVAARKMDVADRQEADALFDAYMAALGMLPDSPPRVHVHTHVENIEENTPAPHPTAAAGGQPDQRSDADGAKMEGVASASPERAASADHLDVQSEQAADNFEPPAFLIKREPLRPHCLNPDLCAGSGRQHCHACTKAMSVPA